MNLDDQYFHGIDDVDVAFARLERVTPPAHLHGAVMFAIAERARTRRRRGYGFIGGAILLATLCSFLLGQQLRITGTLEVLSLVLQDLDLFLDAPLDLLAAVGEDIPWLLVAPALVALGSMVWSVRLALTPTVRPRVQQPEGFGEVG